MSDEQCFDFDDDDAKGSSLSPELGQERTETIDLASLLPTADTKSGSFDIRGQIWTTTFGKLLHALPIPAFLIDTRHDVVHANQSCTKISSEYETTLGAPFCGLFRSSGAREKVRLLLEEIFFTRKTEVVEEVLSVKEREVWARVTFRSLRISGERFLLALVEDLTNEKMRLQINVRLRQELERRVEERTVMLTGANEKLQRAEGRYRRLFDEAPLMYVTTRNEQVVPFITDCNESFLSTVGYSREYVVGQPLADFYSPESRSALLEGGGYARALAGEFFIGERQLVTRDGKLVPTLLYTARELDSSGNVSGTRAMFVDISDLKSAEAALRLRNSAIDGSISGISIADLEGNLTNVNPSALRLWGYDHEEEVLGKRALGFWITEKEAEDGVEIAAKTGAWIGELVAKRKDGSPLALQAAISLVKEPNGASIALMGSFLDVSERKRFEKALKESEARYRLLVENANELICVVQDGMFVFANSKALTGSGYSLDELTSMSFLDVVHPEDRDVPLNLYEQAMSGQEAGGATVFRLIDKSGAIRWGLVSVVRIEWEKRPAVLVLGTDITDLKKAEQKRRESEERYRAVFQDATDAILIVRPQGEILDANPSCCDLLGSTKEEIVGANVVQFYWNPAHQESFRTQVDKKGFVRGFEWEVRKKDGRKRICVLNSSAWRSSDGDLLGYLSIAHDVTESRALQSQLLQAQKMEAIGTLAGGVAHDFNNILQVALGYSQLILGDEELPGHYRADLQKINESSKRGAELVQRLLTFSRKADTKLQPLNLNLRITDMREMLQRTIPKMIDIQLILAKDLAAIHADPTQVDQVLMNLAVNARDAMPEGGKLIVETANIILDEEYASTFLDAKPGRYALLIVTDTGAGMDKETLEHIFEPFFTTKGPGEGTGLGLATVFGIVKQHHGFINCYSEVGHGTTFKIYLPAVIAEAQSDKPVVISMPQGGTETILLVDDEELILDLGKRILAKAGYKVITASNGKDALEVYRARSNEIALVVLDLIMPEMGGKQCLKELLKIDRKARVLIASGFAANGQTKEDSKTGARGFVGKPYNIRGMLQAVREVLDAER